MPAESGLEIIQTSDAYNNGYLSVFAEVRNNSSVMKGYVQVDVSFKDANGRIIGTGMGNTTNVAPGSAVVIECLALDVQPTEGMTYTTRVTGM